MAVLTKEEFVKYVKTTLEKMNKVIYRGGT